MKKGWQTKKIGEVCALMTGGTPSKGKPEYFGGEIRWLLSGDIHQGEIFDCEGRITEAGMRSSNAKYLPLNSVMIALNGQGKTRGTVALLRTKATCNQSLVSIYPKEPGKLLPEYLYANLHGRYQEIRQMTGDSGNDRRGLNMGLIKGIEIPIAPVSVQQRIVDILDKTFDSIATAKANAEKNLQNARALFESHLQSVFAQQEEGWPTKQLGDVCDFEGGSQPPKSQFIHAAKKGYVRFLQIRDFRSEKHITFIPESKKNRLCREEDIMIGRYGASVGKILTGKAGAYNVALMKTIPDPTLLDRSFFYHYLISGAFQERLMKVASRSAQDGFSKEDIYGFPVPVPLLREQQQVINRIGPLSKETQHLESIYQRKLDALDRLKKSLLHQAFSGNL